jgi:protein SCO1
MKNTPKAGLLIVTLVIPALIFVFLRFFARNHYDLPHYQPVIEGGNVKVQHGDTVFQQFTSICGSDIQTTGKLTIVYPFKTKIADSLDAISSQLHRFEEVKTEIDNIQLVVLTSDSSSTIQKVLNLKNWRVLRSGNSGNAACAEEDRLTLIDSDGYIRGYYKVASAEESDRLMAELKILQYQRNKE